MQLSYCSITVTNAHQMVLVAAVTPIQPPASSCSGFVALFCTPVIPFLLFLNTVLISCNSTFKIVRHFYTKTKAVSETTNR
jgi:hypothetical protein